MLEVNSTMFDILNHINTVWVTNDDGEVQALFCMCARCVQHRDEEIDHFMMQFDSNIDAVARTYWLFSRNLNKISPPPPPYVVSPSEI